MRNVPNLVGWGAGGWEIRLVAALLSMFFRWVQAPTQGLWVLCAENGCGLAFPRCEKSFRPIALCLAEIEPFYWHSDSSNTVIGSMK